jgi:hypothetical protein
MPGVGCANKYRFCCTSHFFGDYKPFLSTGREMLDVCRQHEEHHGQDQIWFRHPEFMREESRDLLKAAFQRDSDLSGASLLRSIDTMLRGYRYACKHSDPRVRRRAESFVLTRQMRSFLPVARLFSANQTTADLATRLESEYRTLFGRRWLKEQAVTSAVTGFATAECLRVRFATGVRQPGKNLIRYRWQELGTGDAPYMTPAFAPEA